MADEVETAHPMPGQRITGRQLARQLGISQSTISRAFSPGAIISPEMREKVMEAARKQGYQPNVIARSLSTHRSGIVGIVTANLANPFYVAILQPLARRLQELGLQTLLFTVPTGQQIDSQLPLLLQYNVDAIVVMTGTISAEMAQSWTGSGRLLVPFSYSLPHLDLPAVTCDNEAGGRAIGEFLVRKGHRRPAFVGGHPDSATSIDRRRGFTAALAATGVPLLRSIDTGEYTYEGGHAAALEVGRSQPDAIFFADDVMALGGMDALRFKLGLEIPRDVSVIGFDNIPLAAWPTYQLTTFSQPAEDMVEAAVQLLTVRNPETPPASSVLPGRLVERRTVLDRAAP